MLYCVILDKILEGSIISEIKTNLCGGPLGFNYKPEYYISFKDGFINRFLTLKIKTVRINIHETTYPL